MNKELDITDFIDGPYKEFAYYVISNRALPSIKDGLKPVQRRILWIAKDSAKDLIKVSSLAGRCLTIHPHGDSAISGAIATMAQNFCGANNHPILTGDGAFGCKTLGPGNGVGAPRYVSVKINDITKKVIFKDLELVNEIPNYDGEHKEADHFLPIMPVALLNGISGIAVGFSTEILPYNIKDILKLQKKVIEGKSIKSDKLVPYFKGFNGDIYYSEELGKYKSRGVFKREKGFLHITELPLGTNREKFAVLVNRLIDKDIVKKCDDDSKDEYNIKIFFKRKKYDLSDEQILSLFKLESTLNENLVLIDSNDKLRQYTSPNEIIEEFANWRFKYIKKRYELYNEKLRIDIDKTKELLKFIIYVVKNNYVKKMTTKTKDTIVEELVGEFPTIVSLLNMSISNFTEDTILQLRDNIKKNENTFQKHSKIIGSDRMQRDIFITELNEIKLI